MSLTISNQEIAFSIPDDVISYTLPEGFLVDPNDISLNPDTPEQEWWEPCGDPGTKESCKSKYGSENGVPVPTPRPVTHTPSNPSNSGDLITTAAELATICGGGILGPLALGAVAWQIFSRLSGVGR